MPVTVEISGTKETIRTLSKIDPELRKEFVRSARAIGKPMVDAAKAKYTVLPLSGFRRRWSPGGRAKPITPTTISRFRSGVSFRVDASKKARTVFRLTQRNAAAEIVDMAGRATPGNPLDRSLTSAGFGTPSRVMWPAALSKQTQVVDGLRELVRVASERINQEMR